jgi:hypothetical protein
MIYSYFFRYNDYILYRGEIMKELKIRDLSNYELFSLLRMKSLREYRSIESILSNEDFFLSIQYQRGLKDRMKYLKLKYNL